jgi:mono/diheme cytochrome c family protein
MNSKHLLPTLLLLAAAAGCLPDPKKTDTKATGDTVTPTTATTAAVAANAADPKAVKEMFDARCGACHGTSGKGDGPGAAALNPKPRNYSDKAWQASVTDEQIKKTIVYGGAAVGKSPNMPGNPDLDGKPEVVDGLVKIVRGFGQ